MFSSNMFLCAYQNSIKRMHLRNYHFEIKLLFLNKKPPRHDCQNTIFFNDTFPNLPLQVRHILLKKRREEVEVVLKIKDSWKMVSLKTGFKEKCWKFLSFKRLYSGNFMVNSCFKKTKDIIKVLQSKIFPFRPTQPDFLFA